MKNITCIICGKKFETNKPNKKYCCLSCKEAGRKLQRMKWEDTHPGYYAKYMKEYRTARNDKNKEEDGL